MSVNLGALSSGDSLMWTSVNEKLPENSDDVLVYVPNDGCFRAWYDNGAWLCHENHNSDEITHWMPMPEPPRTGVANGSGSYGMTDKLITSNTRPYSVWSESVETARDIRQAWEARFGGTYKIFRNNRGFQVKYMGAWSDEPIAQ